MDGNGPAGKERKEQGRLEKAKRCRKGRVWTGMGHPFTKGAPHVQKAHGCSEEKLQEVARRERERNCYMQQKRCNESAMVE